MPADPRAKLERAQRAANSVASRQQTRQSREAAIDALIAQRAKAIQAGAMESEFPMPTEGMSIADIKAYQQRLNARMGIPNQSANQNTGQPVATQQPPPPDPMTPEAITALQDEMTRQVGITTADLDSGRASPMEAAAQQGALAQSASNAVRTATAPPPDPMNPMEEAVTTLPFTNGQVLPKGANVQTTGAGSTVEVRTQSGTRQQAFQPTMEQALHARTGGKWAGWTRQQRAAYLRSQPPTGTNTGTVVGRETFNARGDGSINGVSTNTYDPRRDRRGTVVQNQDGSREIVGRTKTAPGDFARVRSAAVTPDPMQPEAQVAATPAAVTNAVAAPPVAPPPVMTPAGTATPADQSAASTIMAKTGPRLKTVTTPRIAPDPLKPNFRAELGMTPAVPAAPTVMSPTALAKSGQPNGAPTNTPLDDLDTSPERFARNPEDDEFRKRLTTQYSNDGR